MFKIGVIEFPEEVETHTTYILYLPRSYWNLHCGKDWSWTLKTTCSSISNLFNFPVIKNYSVKWESTMPASRAATMCFSIIGFVWPRGFGMPLHAESRYCWCTGDLQRLPQNNQSSTKLHILLFLVHICHLWGSLSQSWPQVHTRLCDGHMMYQYVDRLQQNHDIYCCSSTSKQISIQRIFS